MDSIRNTYYLERPRGKRNDYKNVYESKGILSFLVGLGDTKILNDKEKATYLLKGIFNESEQKYIRDMFDTLNIIIGLKIENDRLRKDLSSFICD